MLRKALLVSLLVAGCGQQTFNTSETQSSRVKLNDKLRGLLEENLNKILLKREGGSAIVQSITNSTLDEAAGRLSVPSIQIVLNKVYFASPETESTFKEVDVARGNFILENVVVDSRALESLNRVRIVSNSTKLGVQFTFDFDGLLKRMSRPNIQMHPERFEYLDPGRGSYLVMYGTETSRNVTFTTKSIWALFAQKKSVGIYPNEIKIDHPMANESKELAKIQQLAPNLLPLKFLEGAFGSFQFNPATSSMSVAKNGNPIGRSYRPTAK